MAAAKAALASNLGRRRSRQTYDRTGRRARGQSRPSFRGRKQCRRSSRPGPPPYRPTGGNATPTSAGAGGDGKSDGCEVAAAAAVRSCETALDVVRRAVEARRPSASGLAAEESAAVGTLRAAEAAFTRLSAEESALAEVVATEQPGGRGVLGHVAVEAGCESALAAALGDLRRRLRDAPACWRALPLCERRCAAAADGCAAPRAIGPSTGFADATTKPDRHRR